MPFAIQLVGSAAYVRACDIGDAFSFFGCKLVARRLKTIQEHFGKKAHLVAYYLRISHINNLSTEKYTFSSMCWSSVIVFA